MEACQTKRQYLFCGQPMYLADIPQDADYECIVNDEYDEVLGVEVYQYGSLSISQSLCRMGEAAEEAARRYVQIMQQDGVLPESGSVRIRVPMGTDSIQVPFDVEDDHLVGFFELYHYDIGTQTLHRNDELSDERYQLEVGLQEPLGVIFKRAWLNADGALLLAEYPFYQLSPYGTLREEMSFKEVSELGENILVQRDQFQPDDALLSMEPVYYYPAGRDEILEPMQCIVDRSRGALVDSGGNPIDPSEMQNHEQVMQIFLSQDDTPLSVDHLVEGQLIHSEIIDVPIEQHYFAFHAYIRQLHRELKLIHGEGAHYVYIHSPLMDYPSENIPLEQGQTRQHTSIFHFEGNVIVHECKVFDSEGNIAREYSMVAPGNEEGIIETTSAALSGEEA